MFKKKLEITYKKALCWAIYYGDDNKDVDVSYPQTMQCILCYNNRILISNLEMATINTIGQFLTKIIISKLLGKYIQENENCCKYVNDEGSYINVMTIVLKFVVSYNILLAIDFLTLANMLQWI
jgi:hypothetical protein